MTNKDSKKPELLQKELQKAFAWSTNHTKLVLGMMGGLIVAGGGFALWDYVKQQNEIKLQSEYFQLEKLYLDKKTKFDQAEAEKKNQAALPKDQKQDEKKAAATGDLNQDYGDIVTRLETFVDKNPKSVSAKMAALNLSELYTKYQKPEQSLNVLNKVKDQKKDLLSGLVKDQLATTYANKNDCQTAVSLWKDITTSATYEFLHPSAKVKAALCYESLKDIQSAKKLLEEVMLNNSDSSAAKNAAKYLQLIETANVQTQ